MTRLPITIRLTLVFAAAMAALLLATGVFVHIRLKSELDKAVEEGLRSRADDVAAFVRRSGPGQSRPGGRLTEAHESVAQVLDVRGRVVGGSPELRDRPILTPAEVAQAARRPVFLGPRLAAGLGDERLRLLATSVDARQGRMVVAVGVSIDDREDALASLTQQLLIGGPVAHLLATLIAFAVTRAALAPVESMRRQAAAISGAEPDRRLPVPPTGDELSRLGETLNGMLARLGSALAQERAFVSDASHELRSPLAVLKMELELALRPGRSREELQDAVRAAADETDRLVRIAEDLLVIARSEQRKLPVRRERLDVGSLIESVVQRFSARAEQLGSALESSAPPGLTVMADALRLEQALGNMVDNALRHGGGRIEVAATERGGQLELHVRDHGPGFSRDFLGRAFERFARGEEAQTREGSGLGLAVVKAIAVAHGGGAHACNAPEGGADVWLCLPMEAGEGIRRRVRPEPVARLSELV